MTREYDAVLLAAQRPGVVNPLAARHSVSHKCIIPIVEIPLLERVLQTLTTHQGCRTIHLIIEESGWDAAQAILAKFADNGPTIVQVAPDTNIAESALRGCKNGQPPFIFTTADNVLLKHASLDAVMDAVEDGAETIAALAHRDDVLAVHPLAQRHFYEFADGGYANCNLYAIANENGLNGIETFRGGGQFMSSIWRLIKAFGLINIGIYLSRRLTVDEGFAKLSRHFGFDLRVVHIKDGTQATDVDNERTYDIVEGVLLGRY